VILVSSMVGAAYAMWDKSLWMYGTVNTGKLHLEIIDVSSGDPPGAKDPGKDKDVGCTTVTWETQTITVTITNAYPCYYVYIHFTVHNDGTIPAKLQSITIKAPPELTVTGWNSIGEQIDPCENRDNTIKVHVEQWADQGSTYTFTVEFYYVQWNEYVPPP